MNNYKEFVEETGQGLRFTAWNRDRKINKISSQNLNNKSDIDCDCHMQIGGSGKACPDCKKNGCGLCTKDDEVSK